jgi:NAD(P)-dependent dehydrogenase (short-subunit alcohol dehydrogenase family)
MRLQGKTAVITGGAKGIGLACARRFAQEGGDLVLADIDADAGKAAAEKLAAAGCRVEFVVADVGEKNDVVRVFDVAERTFGGADILVANAGIHVTGEFLEVAEEDFDRVLRTNLKSVFLCGQAAARSMVKQGRGGSIVNLSSINALMPNPDAIAYATSKGGINALTKAMAVALSQYGIRVNALGPGTIVTDLARGAVLKNDQALGRVLGRTPLGRLGMPDEVAGAAAFLASDDASYITGQTLYVDGGRLGLNYTVEPAAAGTGRR